MDSSGAVPGWLDAILRMPLVGKIAGANAAIVAVAIVASGWLLADDPHRGELLSLLVLALAAGILINVVLVVIALSPLDHIVSTAERIWRGELEARVPPSVIADANLRRVGSAINALLDGLATDRLRLRRLAADSIDATDRERARIAAELHNSVAQTLAALQMEVSVTSQDLPDPAQRARLEQVRRVLSEVLEEVKLLAHEAHPRVLEDESLRPAFEQLVRDTAKRTSATVHSEVDPSVERVPQQFSRVFYRIAQQAVDNAVRHADARRIEVRMRVDGSVAVLQVSDDGAGFDVEEAERNRAATGLFAIRERANLLGGSTDIASRRGQGTTVTVRIPIEAASAVSAVRVPEGASMGGTTT